MKTIVKIWGGGLGIYFDADEIKIYDLKEGDIVDVELVKVRKKKNGK